MNQLRIITSKTKFWRYILTDRSSTFLFNQSPPFDWAKGLI